MERAAIVGVYDYIGYSLCRYMLDAGLEVDGIHPAGNKEDYYTEEKRLEIGRNANFSEIDLADWKVEKTGESLFVSLFELLLERSGTVAVLETLLNKLEGLHAKKLQTVLILPAYFAQENVKHKENESELNRMIYSKESNVLTIYLPTIFGPWQPEKFYFQQVMLKSTRDGRHLPDIGPWEWTDDCLYIDDAVKTIKELAESGERGQYILSSGKLDRWKECAKELLGNDIAFPRTAQPTIKPTVKVWKVSRNEQVSRGLSKQKELYDRLQDSQD